MNKDIRTQIIRDYARNHDSISQIANRYDVNKADISHIISNRVNKPLK